MNASCRFMDGGLPSETVAPRRKARGQGGWRPGAGRKPELEDAVSVTLHLERQATEEPEASTIHLKRSERTGDM